MRGDGFAEDGASSGGPKRASRKGWAWRAVLFVVGGYATAFVAASIFAWGYQAWIGLKQDQCSFGPVSNEPYRRWLVRAQEMRGAQGQLLDRRFVKDPQSGRLSRTHDIRFAEISKEASSFEEQVAIVHAMMRADGLVLRSTGPDQADPYSAVTRRIGFNYERFSTMGLVLLCVVNCKNRAVASFSNVRQPGDPPSFDDLNQDRTLFRRLPNRTELSSYSGPDLISPDRRPPPNHVHQCPPLPPPGWAGLLPGPALGSVLI